MKPLTKDLIWIALGLFVLGAFLTGIYVYGARHGADFTEASGVAK